MRRSQTLNELARTDIDPGLLAQAQARLAEKHFKITALTHELAYYRRIPFGKASEALAGEQRLLFEETVIWTWLRSRKNSTPRHRPSGSARVPAVRRCHRNCRASNTVMNRNPASAANAVPTCQDRRSPKCRESSILE
ncbi:transposase domain-containing protein [Janthinobacterium sp. RB2P8]|uniref:transposase domain-containing protein n=1 Tax=Janthinobacterium sp. RB2P8 TaxID=3424191 RepID=UPI003F1F0E93